MTDYTIQLLGAQELDDKTLQQVNGLLHLLNPEASTIEAGRLAQLIEKGTLILFVAKNADGHISGMLTLCICPTLAQDKLWIEDVVVDDSCRRKGIGRELVRSAIAHSAATWPGSTIYLTSNPTRQAARILYVAEGFEEYDTGVFRMKP